MAIMEVTLKHNAFPWAMKLVMMIILLLLLLLLLLFNEDLVFTLRRLQFWLLILRA